MKFSATVPSLDGATLQRLMRRQTLDPIISGLKITLGIVAFLLLAALIAHGINTYLDLTNTSSTLAQAVEAAKARVLQQKENPAHKVELSVITQRNIFGPIVPVSTGPKVDPNPPKPAVKTPLSLIGTFITASEPPYAIIEDDKKKIQDVFGVGDTVFGEAKVLTIGSDRVEIDRNGQREVLTIDDTVSKGGSDFKGGIAALEGDRYMVEEAELDKALENLPMLLTQARAVPYFRDGKAMGLRLFAVKSGSLYEKLGLRNGDILKGINGNSLADLSQAMQLFEKLKTERSIGLSLERGSEEKEFKYEIR